MRREGLALSCSPRCFIISSIEDGRGTTFNSWAISGDALEVAVVFVFSLAGSQLASIATAASAARTRAEFQILMIPPQLLDFLNGLSQKAGQEQTRQTASLSLSLWERVRVKAYRAFRYYFFSFFPLS